VRTPGVVLPPELIDHRLGILQAGERSVRFHALDLQRLVPPLELAGGGRRPDLGEQVLDAVLATDPVEQHLRRPGLVEPAGELLAVEFLRDVKRLRLA
jgi:hypothetical protein